MEADEIAEELQNIEFEIHDVEGDIIYQFS